MHVNNTVLAVVEGGRGRPTRRHKRERRLLDCASSRAERAASTKVQHTARTEADCYSLLVGDGLVAAVTHAHLELKAHEGDGGAFGRTFATHSLATLPAVVLNKKRGLIVIGVIS